jgi:hypothetical protein
MKKKSNYRDKKYITLKKISDAEWVGIHKRRWFGGCFWKFSFIKHAIKKTTILWKCELHCSSNKLTSLKGSSNVGGSFNC